MLETCWTKAEQYHGTNGTPLHSDASRESHRSATEQSMMTEAKIDSHYMHSQLFANHDCGTIHEMSQCLQLGYTMELTKLGTVCTEKHGTQAVLLAQIPGFHGRWYTPTVIGELS